MASAYFHGWISLPTRGEVYLAHGVPRRVWVPKESPPSAEELCAEIAELTGLHMTVSAWLPSEDTRAVEADLRIDPSDIGEVLRRLAHASAVTFFDRYHKAFGLGDTDFTDEAYAHDLSEALGFCRLKRNLLGDPSQLRAGYEQALRGEVDQLARGLH